MFNSRKLSTERTFHATQSLFQFLKRKKHTQLQTSLKINSTSKSSRKDYHNRTRSVIYNTIDQFAVQQTSRNLQKQNNLMSETITPRKIRFQENKNSVGKTSRPFIQMISPLKNKSCNFSDKNQKQAISMKNVQKGSDLYSKKKINQSINLIKSTFHRFVQAGQSTKQKCNTIFCRLSQICKSGQQGQKQMVRKITQLKNNFKAIQSALSIFESANTDQVLEQFHKMLSQHLNTIESINSQHYKTQLKDQINSVIYQKNSQIKDLQKVIAQLNRQNSLLQKNLQKSHSQLQSTIQKYEQRQKNFIQQKEKNGHKLQQKLKQLKQQNINMSNLLAQSQTNLKQLQKQLKNQMYKRQSFQKKQSRQQELVRQIREKFLVQQIQSLKIQFTSDIEKLHLLYQTKNSQLLDKIVLYQKQVKFLQQDKHRDKLVVAKIVQETQFLKQQNVSLLKKNDAILVDMYRMNEELYQHWLALKDVQTLSQRLCIFQNFKTIYKDLAFNPSLFN